jgi:hypothetical protein
MRTIFLWTTAILFPAFAADPPQQNPAPVLRVYVEKLKPGRAAAHESSEAAFPRAFAKANYPAHYIGLQSMSGPEEAWFLEGHASFADVEKAEKASEAPVLKSDLKAAWTADGELLSSAHSLIGVYRPDLSYRAEEAMAGLSKVRYFNVISVRLKPGSEPKLISTVTELFKIYNNAQMTQAVLVYQIISGEAAGLYLLLEPMATLAEWDQYPAMMQSLKNAGGRRFEALQKDVQDFTASEESRLMTVNPRMSYVSKEMAAGDADFWTPRPAAGDKSAKRPAAKRKTGQ